MGQPSRSALPGGSASHRHAACAALGLLQLSSRAGFDQLLDGGFSVGLGHAFLDVLRSAVDQVLGFLQTQAGDFTHGLDDADLVGASAGQDNVELGLLFSSGSTTASSARERPISGQASLCQMW